jgi:hypothetical protein
MSSLNETSIINNITAIYTTGKWNFNYKEHKWHLYHWVTKLQTCQQWVSYTRVYPKVSDWVNNKIKNNNNKHSLKSNTKGYGGKTH